MATLLFSFETGTVPLSRIVDSICAEFNYKPMVNSEGNPSSPLIPNPETKANFARRMIKEYIIKIVKNQDTATAAQSVTPIDLV